MTPKSKLSRKFLLAHLSIIISIALPIVYRKLGIGDEVCMMVLGIVGGSSIGYGVSNAMAKKYDVND